MREVTWGAGLRDFATWQRAQNNSPGTVRNYGWFLLGLASIATQPGDVTTDLLVAMMANPQWGASTRKNARSAYRAFFRWATKQRDLAGNPAEDLPPIRVPRTLPKPTPEPVLDTALRQASPREIFMLRLGACAGLRACEIATVHQSWWDRHSQILYVHGKGGKMRRVAPRDPALVGLLDELRGYAFPNRWTGQPLTPGHVTKLLSRALDETWTGHTLRHRFATTALRKTGNLLAVSNALGHASVATTQIYTLLDDDDLIAVGEATVAA